jgi:DNA-binding transcriptional LysR family regulator
MHHIRYFLAVSETLNLTKAAERCNVAQPALSRAIQDLESELGGAVLDPVSRDYPTYKGAVGVGFHTNPHR